VATGPDWQLVLVDLPGVQRPRDLLTERMQRRVERELAESDAALLILNAQEGVGPGDHYIAAALADSPAPVITVVNKIDKLSKPETARALAEAAELDVGEDVFPISARRGTGVGPLVAHLRGLLPEGPFYFPPDERTDQSELVLLAELIREQVLRRTFQEVPHAVEVEIEELREAEASDLMIVHARIWVENDSQKGILIGAGGRMIKAIGMAARKELERELRRQVHLDLTVRVRRRWRADEGLLDRLGIE
jgi:GTP-binding protein Era